MTNPEKTSTEKTAVVVARVALRVGEPFQTRVVPPGEPVGLRLSDIKPLQQRDLLIRQPHVTRASSLESPSPDSHTIAGTDKLDALVDAIADLSPEDFGKDGKPSVKALATVLAEDISASERDAAWTRFQALMGEESYGGDTSLSTGN